MARRTLGDVAFDDEHAAVGERDDGAAAQAVFAGLFLVAVVIGRKSC